MHPGKERKTRTIKINQSTKSIWMSERTRMECHLKEQPSVVEWVWEKFLQKKKMSGKSITERVNWNVSGSVV